MAQERITVDPNRMRGLPSIRDTRVTVSAVLGQLAAGASVDELPADYPYLERGRPCRARIRSSRCAGARAGSCSAGSVKLFLDANFSPGQHGCRVRAKR